LFVLVFTTPLKILCAVVSFLIYNIIIQFALSGVVTFSTASARVRDINAVPELKNKFVGTQPGM